MPSDSLHEREEEYGIIHHVWLFHYVAHIIQSQLSKCSVIISTRRYGKIQFHSMNLVDVCWRVSISSTRSSLPFNAEVLENMWQIYNPLIASLILNETFQFEKKKLIQGEDRFAWYLRDASGIIVRLRLTWFYKKGRVQWLRFDTSFAKLQFLV